MDYCLPTEHLAGHASPLSGRIHTKGENCEASNSCAKSLLVCEQGKATSAQVGESGIDGLDQFLALLLQPELHGSAIDIFVLPVFPDAPLGLRQGFLTLNLFLQVGLDVTVQSWAGRLAPVAAVSAVHAHDRVGVQVVNTGQLSS